MPTFSYTARDDSGVPSTGTMNAASIGEVGRLLRADRKYPISVKPIGDSSVGTISSRAGGIKIARADLIQFSTQLAIMVETGVTLSEALDCLTSQSNKPNIKQLVAELSTAVQSGTDLSGAMAKHPRSFPRLYVALIRAAEKSGMLTKLLHRATGYLRDEHETVRKVRGALTYPAIMFGFAISTTVFLLTFVMPRFTAIYAAKGAALPTPTKILMTMSDFLVHRWPFVIGLVAAGACAWIAYVRTLAGRRAWHAGQLKLPLIGAVLRKMHLSRSMRMIGTMASSGINLVECVATANDLSSNESYKQLWANVSARIQQGKPMADAMSSSPLVPLSVAQMIHSGEKSGKLAMVMEQIAQYSEQELKEKITDLTRYIEPAMIVVMGFIIGGVALALMLPIFTISRVVAK